MMKSYEFRWTRMAKLAAGIALMGAAGAAAQDAGTGDIMPALATGRMFLAAPIPLAAAGYTEREVFLSGIANRYRFPGALSNAEVLDTGHRYKTRMIVRAPVDPARFNGMVVVEWLNVTTRQDGDFVFGPAHEYLLRDGYAYVGVTVQRGGIATLRRMNPARYASLSLDAPEADAQGKVLDPAGPGGMGGDVLAWDVWTQVAREIRAGRVLKGLKVKRVIASGQSQSALKLTTYYNSIQPLAPVYDGYIFYDRADALRADIDTKAIAVGTEFFNDFRGPPPPDTAAHRWWEIAGAAHNSYREIAGYIDPSFLRDGANRNARGNAMTLSDIIPANQCAATPIWSRVPNGFVLSAAFAAMKTWLTTGKSPPVHDRLVVDGNGKLRRDGDGMVGGGIRTATYTVPNATNVGVNTGGGFCRLVGSHTDYTEAQMCVRYGNPRNYVTRLSRALDENVAQGVLLRADADTLLGEARQQNFRCR